MNADLVNVIYTSQKLTKGGFCEEIEVDFTSSKAINLCQQAVTLNRHPCQNISQTCGKSNLYVRFRYGPQTIFNCTQGQVSVSMNSYPINVNKQVNNKQR